MEESTITIFYLSNNFLQVLREILQVLDGTMLDVTRAGSIDTECIDTSQIFFVCFGKTDQKEKTFAIMMCVHRVL